MALFRKHEGRQVLELPVDALAPNPNQPRKHFSQEELNELADSISQLGVMQPSRSGAGTVVGSLSPESAAGGPLNWPDCPLCHAWKYPPQMKPLPLWP